MGPSWKCTKCGWLPNSTDGVVKFAPHIEGANDSYDPAWFAKFAKLEEGNFWFKSRNRCLQWLFKKHFDSQATYLEIGCGTGFVLKMVTEKFPYWQISASEAHVEGLKFANQRANGKATLLQIDACDIPFRHEFDVVGAFDVIEHIEDDVRAISEIKSALKPGGYFVVTVPQHMVLWSVFDEIGCHYRRYSRNELENKLKQHGFNICTSTSFVSMLFPAMLISRFLSQRKAQTFEIMDEFKISPIINKILELIQSIELLSIRAGFRWPFGGSRIIVAQKGE